MSDLATKIRPVMVHVSPERQLQIETLIADAARLLDDSEFEEWVGLFTDDCVYRITSRENYDGNLPMAVVFCDSKGMLRDRVVSLCEANIYNPHYARHLVTNIRVLAEENEVYHVHSSYQVTQTSLDGETRIFSVGRYLDRIVMDGDGPRFKERSVIADTGAIQNLLAVPL